MVSFLKKDNGPPRLPMETQNIPPPQSSEAYAPRSRRVSEEAARAAQNVLDLEFSLKETMEQRDTLRSAFEAIKLDNRRLEDRLLRTEEERDIFKNRVADIEARFDDAASILLKVIDRRLTRPASQPPEVALEQLEREITDGNPPNPTQGSGEPRI
jgi:chromosome segregation ATPase